MDHKSEQLNGWCEVSLKRAVFPRREKVQPQDCPDLPYLGMDNVEGGTGQVIETRRSGDMRSVAARFYTGDVLYGRLRPYLNKVVCASFDGLASAEFIILPGNSAVDSQFLSERLRAVDFVSFAAHLNEGDRPRVNFDQVGDFELRLPPISEQRRIVAKIEELFSELDKGVESLKAARAQLKTYRQSLLKTAFEGRLTEQWRRDNADKLETADQLLQRIREEREARYDQQMANWKDAVANWEATGKVGKKPKRPKRASEPSPGATEERISLPPLPETWRWETLGWMTLGVEYGTSAKSKKSGDVPVIRMGNLQNGQINWDDLAFTSDQEEIEEYLLDSGDVLFNRTNSPELVGKTALYRGERKAIFAGYLIRLNHFKNFVDSRYLTYFLNSKLASDYAAFVKTDGVNQSNINGKKLAGYPFPYCALIEQQKIADQLDCRMSEVDELTRSIDVELRRAELLRQSILQRAFSGKLAPQDPDDEPASVLLERIRAEQEEAPKARGRRRKANA